MKSRLRRLLELCGGTKANNKAAAKARWEALKIDDFIFVVNFNVLFYAAAKKCGVLEDNQFAQYK